MKRHGHDKHRNFFMNWIRSVFQSQHQSPGNRWRCLKRRTSTTTRALLLFLFLLVCFLLLAGLLVLVVYSGQTLGKTLIRVFHQTDPKPEYPLNCTAWNHTLKCPNNYPTTYKPMINPDPSSNPTCPEYFRWIHEDLRPWKEKGITREVLDRLRGTAHFKLVIVNGKAYVRQYKEAIETRALFTLWGIAQLLRWYPGQLPDLELMFDCNDRPVIKSSDYQGPNSVPPPLFRYCSDFESLDIVFPDWSFWGWAEINIRPWRMVMKDIREGNKRTKWEDRVPLAYWRGNPNVCPCRQELMKCNKTEGHDWNALVYENNWDEQKKRGYTQSDLGDQCTHRYKIYIEGFAWSVSEKYILACDSPTLYVTPLFFDFFMRGAIPQKHYWPIKASDKCRSLKFAVEWGNNHTHKAKEIGKESSRFIQEDLKMEYVYDYMFHLLRKYAKLLKFKPEIPDKAIELCPESMACPADGPWRKFMEDSLEKSPSNSIPCTLPPPYDPEALKAFVDGKSKAIKQVEAWEHEYWENQNKKQ